MVHPNNVELRAFCEGRPGRGDNSITAHLAACPECARRLESLLFETAVDSLAAGRGRAMDHPALLRATLAEAAQRAAHETLKARLATWSAEPAALAGGIVEWKPGEDAGGVRASGQVELVTTFTDSSAWQIRTGAAPEKNLAVTSPGQVSRPQAFVNLTGPRELAVQVFQWPAGAASPLVLLAREIRSEPPVVKQARRHPGLPAPSASFRDLIPGRYLLGLEPVPPPRDPQ